MEQIKKHLAVKKGGPMPTGLFDGKYLTSCYDYMLRSPAINEVWEARGHWQNSQLQLRYPNGVPIILLNALNRMEAGFQRGHSEYIKSLNKKGKQ
jgi:hypothetical protein